MPFTDYKDIIISVAALTGMGLGIFNFFNERNKEKIKLKVIPKTVLDHTENGFCVLSINEFNPAPNIDLFAIKVINLSKFPVTIDKVGFNRCGRKNQRYIFIPTFGDDNDKSWPRELKSRESVVAYGKLSGLLHAGFLQHVNSAFASTACGHTKTGKSKALKKLIKYYKLNFANSSKTVA